MGRARIRGIAKNAPSKGRLRRALAPILGLGAMIALVMLLALLPGRAQDADDQGVLAGFVSRLLSTPTSRVSIGAVDGALSSDATIRNVTVADDAGVYLTIDRVRLVWKRAALLQRRIEIQQLEIGRVMLLRRPAPVAGEPEPGPLLPELPLAVEVGAFTLAELALGEPVLGTAARLSARGSASLGAPAQGLRAAFDLERLDAPGAARLRLGFVPQGETLDLALTLDEPAGGLAARLARVPGLPPVRLDLSGAGTLDDWRARLAFEGGPELGATGQARIARQGPERVLGLDLDARIAPLLPALAAPIFPGVTALRGEIAFADGGGVALRSIRLASALAELTLSGSVSAERALDLTARARALPNAGDMAAVGEGRLRRLVFEGAVTGPYAAPRVRGSLDLAGLTTPDFALESLAARFSATPAAGRAGRLGIEASGQARGFAPGDAALADAIGRDLELDIAGELDEGGVASFTRARLASPTLSLDYRGRLGSRTIDGRLGARILRLDALSGLAGRPLTGRAELDLGLTGDPRRLDITTEVTGRTAGLGLGDDRLDRIVGPAVSLDGRARLGGGRLRLDGFRLGAAAMTAELQGAASASDLDLAARIALSDLARLDTRIAGQAEARLKLSGPTADPDASLSLTASRALAMGRPVTGLEIGIEARRPLTQPRLSIDAGGVIGDDRLALQARLEAIEPAPDGARGWKLERLSGSLGSATLTGQGTLGADGIAEGRVSFAASDLDDLTALALRRLAGRASLEITADAARGVEPRQRVAVRGEGSGIVAGEIRLARFEADLAAAIDRSAPSLRGRLSLEGLFAGGEQVELLALTAMEAEAGASAVTLTGRARGFSLEGAGRLEAGTEPAARIDRFRAVRAGRSISLLAPTRFVFAPGGARTTGAAFDVTGGRVSLAGMIGRELDVQLEARGVPLAAAEVFVPGLGLGGTLDAAARLSGNASSPRGPYEVTVRGFTQPSARAAGLPPLGIAARGTLTGTGATLDGSVTGGRGIDLRLGGSAAFSETGPLDLTARGNLDAALANARLAGVGQRLGGRVTVDVSLSGSRRAPRLRGAATLAGGSFSDAVQGISVTALEGRISGQGEALAIERLTGRTRGDGTLAASGRVTLDPARGFPGEIRLTGRRAQLVDSELARLVANLDIRVSGPLVTTPRIGGRVDVVNLDVRVPERFGGAREPLREARHVAPPPQTRARLAQIARASRAGRGGSAPFRAALDLVIDAPSRIFVRGRGLDAELGGTLRLTGTTTAPLAEGAFDLRRGRLTLLTQRLDFTRGRLSFAGAGLVPELDFVAETRAGDIAARVAVTGPANAPDFTFSSSPSLPQDEILSRLLFARAAGGLSAFQAIQLAQAAAQLSGVGGPDAFEAARRALGVDDLDIGFGEGGPSFSFSRAISDRIRFALRAGARPESTGAGVDIDLTRRLRLQSEIGVDGRASVGIGIEQEY